jgi:hypothetical protein
MIYRLEVEESQMVFALLLDLVLVVLRITLLVMSYIAVHQ